MLNETFSVIFKHREQTIFIVLLTMHPDFDWSICWWNLNVIWGPASQDDSIMVSIKFGNHQIIDNIFFFRAFTKGLKGVIDQDWIVAPPGHVGQRTTLLRYTSKP